jgi:hypothetical protein
MNIEFQYMYRDLGNFKNYGSVVFGNKSALSIAAISRALIGSFGEDRNFAASDLGVPNLFFKEFSYDPTLDWEMHEFCSVVRTNLPINDTYKRDIRDLLPQLKEPRGAMVPNRLGSVKRMKVVPQNHR